MSRLLKKLIDLNSNIAVTNSDGFFIITNKSTNESISVVIKNYVNIEILNNSQIKVEPSSEDFISFAGTIHRKIQNAIKDITDKYKSQLKLSGVGFKVSLNDNFLSLSVGRSHDDIVIIPKGVNVKIDSDVLFTCSGIDRELVSDFCSFIKRIKPIEFYKGKGIIEPGQVIKLKVGKKN
jgi:large subunit ribosomal protein L6